MLLFTVKNKEDEDVKKIDDNKYYNTEYVEEVGRSVCENIGGAYSHIDKDYNEISEVN